FSRVLMEFPENRHCCALAEIERVESRRQELSLDTVSPTEYAVEMAVFERIRQKYAANKPGAVQIELREAEIMTRAKHTMRAVAQYQSILQNYVEFPAECAEAQYKVGRLYAELEQQDAARNAYLLTITRYPLELRWQLAATAQIFKPATEMPDPTRRTSQFSELTFQYQHIPLISSLAQMQLAENMAANENYTGAIQVIKTIIRQHPKMKFINFESRIRLARYFLKQGNDLNGIETYQKIITDFSGSADSSFAETAQNELLEMYLESGERLWQLNEIRLSFSRFRRARSLVPSNITAQRGVIKCQYQMRHIDEAIHYYEAAVTRNPENPIFIYALGLSHAYKATEKAEFEGKPFDKKRLLLSNSLVEQALALDYQMIPAYLTLSVNYELLERYDSFHLRQPKSWYQRILSSITTPIESIYRTVLRKPVARPEQYFEKAIHVLHKALTINDEKTDPFTEAQLALNLANNYYQLDEFGFDRAYQFYQYKMELDSTAQSPETETQIFARMGHCALVTEDFEKGPYYFHRAIQGYHNLGKTALEVLNLKRLALLFQLQGNYEQSIHYFSKAAEIQEKRPDLPRAIRFADLEVLYRQLALNYNYLEDDEAVTEYTKRAFDYLESGYIKTVKPEKNWLKIGILGWEFPVYNAGRLVTGQSTASTGFTTPEEKALLFSIGQDSNTRQQHFQQALHALQEKLKIYQELEDKRAQAIILNQIGALFYQTGNFKTARERFSQSLSICEKEPFYEGGLLNIINICTLDFNRGRADSLLRNDGSVNTKIPALPDFSESLVLIEQGLSYYQNEDFLLNPRYKIILLLLQGNFHLLRAGALARSPENIPLYARPQDWLTLLDEVVLADTAFAHAEKIAALIEYPRENALIHLNQALAAELIGEKGQAYNHAQICRGIARRYGFDALHWQVDHFLGRFIWNSGGIGTENDPAFFFNEALEIVHRYPALKQNGTLPALSIAALRQLYLDVGAYFVDTNQPEKALLVREQLYNHMLTEYLAGKQLQLNNAYAQNYWGNARAYQQELLIQRQKLRALVISRTWVNPDKIKTAQAKLNTLQQEYKQLLADMANEIPRLTSLVQIDTPALEKVQEILPNDAVAVVFQLNNQQLFIWTVTADSLHLTTAHKKSLQIKSNLQTLIHYIQEIAADDSLESAAMAVNENLFAPIWSQLADKKHVIIIPDEQLFQLPFNLLLFYQNDQHFRQTVVQTPTLQEYFLNYQNRRIVGSRILFSPGYDSLAADVQALGYAQDTFSTKKSAEDIPQKMSMADILHFDVQLNEQAYDPALSFLTLNANSKARFSTRGTDMFGRQSRNSLAVLDGQPLLSLSPHTVIFMEFALLRAGAATQLWNFLPAIPEVNADFYQEFYQQLTFKPADEALLATWEHIHQKYGYPLSWAGFQLHGYGGMTQTESREFASKSFRRRVLMGNSAFRDQKWDEA
ncbi:tetratricopeptide repeat protein, partial [bacterium]|nr:tetratricopeptide repeat protein [bacterium]